MKLKDKVFLAMNDGILLIKTLHYTPNNNSFIYRKIIRENMKPSLTIHAYYLIYNYQIV